MGRPFNTAWLAHVEAALARGVPHDVIIGELAADLGIPAKRARRYIDAVLAKWTERVTSASPEEQRGELVALSLSVYAEARRKGHPKTALAAIETTAKLLGITKTDAAVAFNLNVDGALGSPEEIRQRIAELRARALPPGGDGGDA
ncbi:MAG TPA: hypothetical protein VEB66_18030 [Opitutaceae bacterium]|nr:hypothetical protein [Opitutaceae bacterium]